MNGRVTWGVKYRRYSYLVENADRGRKSQVFFTEETCIRMYLAYMVGLLPYMNIKETSL